MLLFYRVGIVFGLCSENHLFPARTVFILFMQIGSRLFPVCLPAIFCLWGAQLNNFKPLKVSYKTQSQKFFSSSKRLLFWRFYQHKATWRGTAAGLGRGVKDFTVRAAFLLKASKGLGSHAGVHLLLNIIKRLATAFTQKYLVISSWGRTRLLLPAIMGLKSCEE